MTCSTVDDRYVDAFIFSRNERTKKKIEVENTHRMVQTQRHFDFDPLHM